MAQTSKASAYLGEEKKFAITIVADGFDIDTDDFELEVNNGKESFTVLKTGQPDEQGRWKNADGSLLVFYEEKQTETPAEEPGGEPTVTTTKSWWGIIDTQFFHKTGDLFAVSTAYITDAKACDGVRKVIDRQFLLTLKNK